MAIIFHPGTEGEVDVPAESVWHYRLSGWVLKSEWLEHQQLEAERAEQAAQAEQESARQAARPGSASKAAAGTAGGGDKEK